MVQTFTATGKLTSTLNKTYYMLSSATIVNTVNVREGDHVSKGDIMISFDKTAAELSVKQVEIQVATAKTGLATAKDGIKKIDEGLSELDKAIAQMESQTSSQPASPALTLDELKEIVDEALKTATDEQKPALEAIKRWLDTVQPEDEKAIQDIVKALQDMDLSGSLQDALGGIISGDNILMTLKNQRATLAASRPTEAQIAQLSQAVNLAEEGLTAAKKQNELVLNGVIAEFDGVVTSMSATPGAPVSMGTAVITISDPSTLIATISLQKYDIDKVKVGQTAEIDMFGEKSSASVGYIGFKSGGGGSGLSAAALLAGATGGGDSSSDLFAEISVRDSNKKFILNYECDVTITTGEAFGELILPVEAVKINREGSYCFVVDGEKAVKRDIVLGISSDHGYVVTSGLNDGDIIIINPSNLVVDGTAVLW